MNATFNGQKYTIKNSRGHYPWLAEREVSGQVFAGYGNTPQEACQVCEESIKEQNVMGQVF